MDKIIRAAGATIIRFLNESDLENLIAVNTQLKELCETALLWRSLLQSFNPKSNKEPNKDVRIRSIKKRPDNKYKLNNTQDPIISKQWVFIPPDLESQIKVITINKAAQLRKNENFRQRCFQVMEAWTESISRTICIINNQDLRGDPNDPYSIVITSRDKVKVLEDILEELNDICVAKLDAVFSNTVPHKNFINQIEKVKKLHKESKVGYT
jgi:hypothetical protein